MTNFADLSKTSLIYYTGKWFLIWSLKFFAIGLMGIAAMLVFLKACMPDGQDQE